MEKSAQLLPITVLEDPYQHPMSDPKDADRKVIGVPVGIVPEGFSLVSLKEFFEEYRRKPAQREGAIHLHSTESFISFVNRYKHGKETVIFVHDTHKKNCFIVTAIFDYHPEGPTLTETGAGKFRAVIEYFGGSEVPEIQRQIGLPMFWGAAP